MVAAGNDVVGCGVGVGVGACRGARVLVRAGVLGAATWVLDVCGAGAGLDAALDAAVPAVLLEHPAATSRTSVAPAAANRRGRAITTAAR
jgi:hypothetical protein